MTKPIDRAAMKAQTRELLQTAQVSPKGMTALYCAMQFFLLSLKDHKDAWERYLKLVRRAGLASYTELMQTAGLKVPFEDGSIKTIAQQMGQWIAEHQV